MKLNVKEARKRLSSLLNQVQDGDEVIILRRGKEVARIVPPDREHKKIPSLKDFRSSIRLKGEPMSSVVLRARTEERY